ncbi:MAG TPA: GDSL-type esterase/lipase family protein [Thermoguttaceae bacterium]|nr:GDSL-type esterase/lipase family protein [Thermoguttaceae bacterium]
MSDLKSQPTERPPDERRLRADVTRLARLGRLLVFSVIVAGSLLTFPAATAWMIAVWIGWHTWLVARRRSGWQPLVACAAILLVKRAAWLPGLVAMIVALLAVSGFCVFWRRGADGKWGRLLAWSAVAALWVTWGIMAADWHAAARSGRRVVLDPTRPVVCLGDSLTAGIPPHGSYTDDLAKRIAVPVVNLGQDGITSAEAIEKLPALVKADPQVVVVELGGHDFLKGHGRAATKANLERMIRACRRIGAEVVLMEIPRGLITDPYAGLERELARRHDLELVSDTPIRRLILWSPYAPPGMWLDRTRHLSDDGLHANARGNRVLAEDVAESLARLFGPEIRADHAQE